MSTAAATAAKKPAGDMCQICGTPLRLFGPALYLKKGDLSLHAICIFAACGTAGVTVQTATVALQKYAKCKCDCCGKGSANFFCHACVMHAPVRPSPAQVHIHCAAKSGWLIAKGPTYAGMCPNCQTEKRWPAHMGQGSWRKFGQGIPTDMSLAVLATIAAAQTRNTPRFTPPTVIVFSKAVGAAHAAVCAARQLWHVVVPPKQVGVT